MSSHHRVPSSFELAPTHQNRPLPRVRARRQTIVVRRGWIPEDHPVRTRDLGWMYGCRPCRPLKRVQRTSLPGNSQPQRAQRQKLRFATAFSERDFHDRLIARALALDRHQIRDRDRLGETFKGGDLVDGLQVPRIQTRTSCGKWSKCLSRACNARLCCRTKAASHMSFVGIGVPCFRSWRNTEA